MRSVQAMPAWLERRRSRRLDHNRDDRVVRWIGLQANKQMVTPASRLRPDGWSNDNVIPIREDVAV